ncbi:MAG TPA: SulP family inorganic anion transporter, partial [Aquabacterium sp.]|nr:SulP family inorganic anion transporter [Aquabacterium sp.]
MRGSAPSGGCVLPLGWPGQRLVPGMWWPGGVRFVNEGRRVGSAGQAPWAFPPPWVRQWQRAWLTGDLTAGLVVAVMLVPQSLAYAMLAGLPP